MESVVYAPSKGFDGKATLAVRPGEEASLMLEVMGPVCRPVLKWKRGSVRGSAVFDAVVSTNQMLVCENGQDWKVVAARDWSLVAEGKLPQALPKFSGTSEIEVRSDDAANAFAVVDLTKRYVTSGTGGAQPPSAGAGGKYRFLAFNIWGDFFKNPVHERDLQQLEIVKGHDPDFIGLQEVTPIRFSMDRTQQALDVSDHSPVIFDFSIR